MTPPAMGGDCDLTEANRRVGDKICFIGGFDQNNGFENGSPEIVKEMVQKLFNACPNGGYICSPSDHFFFGNTENIRTFADTCKKCVY
jgi:uroporphyrinogen-III decarboxylase